ncbi:MAG: putative holliday junction resolvase [Candidatus Peribacteria bacterium]|nr:putative holliday junction resolvase [Candidatus Peribacteria bacterium]
MKHFLALDVGTRRTGVAYASEDVGIALPLPTLHHKTKEEFGECVRRVCSERKISHLIIGLPKLPSGDEGEQAGIVREYVCELASIGAEIIYIDERYTTPNAKMRTSKNDVVRNKMDDNAIAAVAILGKYLGY